MAAQPDAEHERHRDEDRRESVVIWRQVTVPRGTSRPAKNRELEPDAAGLVRPARSDAVDEHEAPAAIARARVAVALDAREPRSRVAHLDPQHLVRRGSMRTSISPSSATCSTALATSSETSRRASSSTFAGTPSPTRASRSRASAGRTGCLRERFRVEHGPSADYPPYSVYSHHASIFRRTSAIQRHRPHRHARRAGHGDRAARRGGTAPRRDRPAARARARSAQRQLLRLDRPPARPRRRRARSRGGPHVHRGASRPTASRGASSSSPRWPTGSIWRS